MRHWDALSTRLRLRLGLDREWWLLAVAAGVGALMGVAAIAFIMPIRWLERLPERMEAAEPWMRQAAVLAAPVVGALLTGVFAAPSLGGTGIFDYVANAASPDYSIGGQVWVQFQAVATTIVWSAVVSYIAYKLVDMVIGLRVSEEEEREGLDISAHGESAYNR
jgi:ammonia channel protein AmtB